MKKPNNTSTHLKNSRKIIFYHLVFILITLTIIVCFQLGEQWIAIIAYLSTSSMLITSIFQNKTIYFFKQDNSKKEHKQRDISIHSLIILGFIIYICSNLYNFYTKPNTDNVGMTLEVIKEAILTFTIFINFKMKV